TLAYGIFEVPTGHWGDRIGSRRILKRIVLWWSAFTMLTGACTGFMSLLAAYLTTWLGWRWAFVIFGAVGVVWVVAFLRWFRDDPAKHPSVNSSELLE